MAPARVPVQRPIKMKRATCRNGRLSVSIFQILLRKERPVAHIDRGSVSPDTCQTAKAVLGFESLNWSTGP